MHELATVRHNFDYSWDGTLHKDGAVYSYTTDSQGLGGVGYAAVQYAWDYDMMHGCICDKGYHGYDCMLRECPKGDDPETTGQADEVQLLQCFPLDDGSRLDGTMTLNFKHETTIPIGVNATGNDVKAALEALSVIRQVTVEVKTGDNTFDSATEPICSADKTRAVKITFTHDPGPQPRIKINKAKLVGQVQVAIETASGAIGVFEGVTGLQARRGTKEYIACMGRGLCDDTTGTCACYKNYGVDVNGGCATITGVSNTCPGELPCMGHGVCQSKTCLCSDGWTTGDCSLRTCPMGPAWFDYPNEQQSAHDYAHPVECSNQGMCDRTTGECQCNLGWFGGACERMNCPGDPPCFGHGQCLSMMQLAEVATLNGDATDYTYGTNPHNPKTWDYEMIKGCRCDEGFEGYDCSLRSCPRGDDPETYGQLNEVQMISCVATGGTFRLGFRQEMTSEIRWNATAPEVEAAIEAMTTAGDVRVNFTNHTLFYNGTEDNQAENWYLQGINNGTYGPAGTYNGTYIACNPEGSNIITVEFIDALADLPAMKVDSSKLENFNHASFITQPAGTGRLYIATDGQNFYDEDSVPIVAEHKEVDPNNQAVTYTLKTFLYNYTGLRGTRENKICSGRGTCDYTTGICTCLPGYAQSNGKGGRGRIGDCGYRIPMYKTAG